MQNKIFKFKWNVGALSLLSLLKNLIFGFSFFSTYQIFTLIFKNEKNIKAILLFSLISLIFITFNILLKYWYKINYKKILIKIKLEITKETIKNISTNTPFQISHKSQEEILYYSEEIPQQISNYFYEPIFLLIEDCLKFAVLIGLLFYFNWILGLISIFIGILLILYFNFTIFKMSQYEYQTIDLEENNRYKIEFFLKLHNDFFYLNKSKKWFIKLFKKLKNNHKKIQLSNLKFSWLDFFNQIFLSVCIAIPIILISYFIHFKLFNFTFSIYFISFILISSWSKIIIDIFRTFPAFKIAKQVINELNDFYQKEEKLNTKWKIDFENLTLENLSFKIKEKTLKPLNFKIQKNDKVAFIGPSGVGKTLLTNLITKNTDFSFSGNIYWNNLNINEITNEHIVHNITLIDSENIVLDDSIKNNITLFDESVNDHVIYSILEKLNLKEFKNLNLKANVLSEGQKQRLNLARILMNTNNKILILDEAFNNIDEKTTKQIRSILMKKSKIYIEISHHLKNDLDKFNLIVELQSE
ncbi:ATP-binding cassette domain-containing protein [Mycoplasmopsis cricetuli]|uniref:ATP-binding cassette domain-containing protein n=1 Tax=Mycoplasmopsis cricetuli TaxID=171283 RepID=UPI0004717355|nr:ABC transporter ATP-binding protein [Mycoplasmopsis cricetuli]